MHGDDNGGGSDGNHSKGAGSAVTSLLNMQEINTYKRTVSYQLIH